MTFRVRAGRPGDLASIVEWTADTFSWGDYLPQRLPGWLEDPDSEVLVCADPSDEVLAVAHVTMLSPVEGWLEAARVHPDHRRSGLGKALNEAGVAWASSRGAQIVRLATEADNEPAIRQVLGLGYRKTSSWLSARWKSGEGRRDNRAMALRSGSGQDVDAAWVFWSTSELALAGRGLMTEGWRWRRAHPRDVGRAAAEGRLHQSQAGWVVATVAEGDDTYLRVDWLATEPRDAPALMEGLLDLAGRREAGVDLRLPNLPWTQEVVARAGADPKEILVFAKPA